MSLLEKYVFRTEFDSYDDFCQNFKINVPENFNFAYDIVDEYAKTEPSRLALVWCDDKGEERFFTFADLKYWSDKTANFFKSKGIKKGDKVMLILRRRYEFYFCAMALAKIGAVYIPATFQLTSKDIVYRNNSANIKMIIAWNDSEIIGHVEGAQKDSPTLENLVMVGGNRDGWLNFAEQVNEASEDWERPTGEYGTQNDDLMIIYFTSGTTSMPKMAAQNFTYPLGHIVTANYWQRVIDGGLHLTVADSGWAKFGWGKLYGQWICGAVQFVYDMDKFIPKVLLEKMEKYRLSTFCAPPTIYRFLLQEELSNYDLTSIVHCSTAGEPLNHEVYNRFLKETGIRILDGFGQSETTVLVANFEWFETHPGSMGKPNPAYDIDIVDENGEPCAAGVEGELIIRCDGDSRPVGLFGGYYCDDQANAKAWRNNMYHTGDVVYRDENGYFWFVGRNDDVIKASGYRISPFEVESALIEHPGVIECAVTGAPDGVRGIVVKATVVLAAGFQPTDDLKKELQNHVKKVTAPYKYPRIIEFVDELPKTISGKIRRAEIRKEDNEKFTQQNS